MKLWKDWAPWLPQFPARSSRWPHFHILTLHVPSDLVAELISAGQWFGDRQRDGRHQQQWCRQGQATHFELLTSAWLHQISSASVAPKLAPKFPNPNQLSGRQLQANNSNNTDNQTMEATYPWYESRIDKNSQKCQDMSRSMFNFDLWWSILGGYPGIPSETKWYGIWLSWGATSLLNLHCWQFQKSTKVLHTVSISPDGLRRSKHDSKHEKACALLCSYHLNLVPMCAMIITAYYSFRKFETMHTVVSLWLSKLGSWNAQFWVLAQKVLCCRWTLDLPAVTCFTDSRRKGSMKTAISLGSKAKKSSRLTFDHAGLKQSSICWDFRWLTVNSWRCNGMRQLCQHGPGDHDTVSTFRELHRWRNSHSTGSARCERCEDVYSWGSPRLEACQSISKHLETVVLECTR